MIVKSLLISLAAASLSTAVAPSAAAESPADSPTGVVNCRLMTASECTAFRVRLNRIETDDEHHAFLLHHRALIQEREHACRCAGTKTEM